MSSKMPNGDKWELIDNDNNSQHYGKKFKFDFSYIESDSIKNVVKAYIWKNYKEGNITLNKLKQNLSLFANLNTWLMSNNIVSLSSINNNEIDNLVSFLKTLISTKTKKP